MWMFSQKFVSTNQFETDSLKMLLHHSVKCRQWNHSSDNMPDADTGMELEHGTTFDVFEALAPALSGNGRGKPLGRTRFFQLWKERKTLNHIKV